MKPMFSYLGAKYRLAVKYGAPRHETVIEPFAGSAAYSLYWEPKRVILCDINPVITGIWRYLITAKEKEILTLPDDFNHVDELDIPTPAKHLIGFWIGKGKATPGLSRSTWGRQYKDSGDCKVWGEQVRQRIATNLPKIRHWEVIDGDYTLCPEIKAHWFIDPPYEIKGKLYKHSKLDFKDLREWVESRKGFVQVCENEGADWLPFETFHHIRSQAVSSHRHNSKEVLYQRGM